MHSPQELKHAVDALFRIRAVESPPDAAGSKRIWHRGTAGAELFTEVDAQGRVLRQELTLFDELVRWDREHGFQPPQAAPAEGAGPQERLGRAAGALARYGGPDRFLKHLKEQVVAEVRGAVPPVPEAPPGRRHGVERPLPTRGPAAAASRSPLLAVVFFALGLGALLAWLWSGR